MQVTSAGLQFAVIKLCVLFGPSVGGFDGSSYLKSVEWLDKGTKQWKLAGSMSYRRLGCGVGVVWTS